MKYGKFISRLSNEEFSDMLIKEIENHGVGNPQDFLTATNAVEEVEAIYHNKGSLIQHEEVNRLYSALKDGRITVLTDEDIVKKAEDARRFIEWQDMTYKEMEKGPVQKGCAVYSNKKGDGIIIELPGFEGDQVLWKDGTKEPLRECLRDIDEYQMIPSEGYLISFFGAFYKKEIEYSKKYREIKDFVKNNIPDIMEEAEISSKFMELKRLINK